MIAMHCIQWKQESANRPIDKYLYMQVHLELPPARDRAEFVDTIDCNRNPMSPWKVAVRLGCLSSSKAFGERIHLHSQATITR